MMKRTSILLTLLMTVSILSAQLPLSSRRVTTADGLSGNTINELVQDRQGYIWMATNNGLSRYDGYSTVNRREARIGRIYHDEANGLLWLSTATYQIACYDLKRARFVDWTGTGDGYRQLNKVMVTRGSMVFYGMDFGARRSTYRDGQFHTTDFTKENGRLMSNRVLTVVEDSTGNLWLPTDNGITLVTPQDECRQLEKGQNIIAAATSRREERGERREERDMTYFLTASGQVLTYDSQGHKVRQTALPPQIRRPERVNANFMWQGQWMLFTPEGTIALDVRGSGVRGYGGTGVRDMRYEVKDGLNQGTCPGYHFIGTRTGELWLFPDSGEARKLQLIPNAPLSMNKGWLFHVTPDRQGRLFIATYGNGLFVYEPTTGTLSHYTANDAQPVIDSNYLTWAITDHHGNIWVGSETTGAYCLTTEDREAVRYLLPQPDRRGGWENSIVDVRKEESGERREERDMSGVRGARYEVVTRDGRLYETDGMTSMKAAGSYTDSATCRITDRQGRTWTATFGRGIFCDGRQYMAEGINASRVNDLLLTDDGTLWAASNNGVYRWNGQQFDVYNTQNGLFPYDEIHTLCLDMKGRLWAGTAGGGVVKCTLDKDAHIAQTEVITTREGLSNNNASSMVCDADGYLWVGTEDGISRINTQDNTVSTYRFSKTLQGNVIENNCALLTDDGRLLFGTSDGLLVVDPKRLLDVRKEERGERRDERGMSKVRDVRQGVRLTDLRINGTSGYESGLIGTLSDAITLKHDQNSLAFYFSDFQYDSYRSAVYQYWLEGHEHGWRPMTTSNHADYSELPPGRYTFHLRTLDDNNEWGEETVLQVTISEPWWNTWWAWAVYLLVLAAVGFYVYRNWRERFRLHQQMKMERQLAEFRTSIFTNITHEFRTPLAIIKGAVDKLAADGNNHAAQQTAQRATNRMLRMVNQFMEYRKLSTGNVRLQVESGDVVPFIRNLADDLRPMALQKEQTFTFTPFAKHYQMLFDQEKLEMIVYNLLSNAIKYTPERGTVSVKISEKGREDREEEGASGGELSVVVEDNGPGISDEQQAALFRPFMHGHVSRGGMGIGLHTAHQMAMAHHGTLTYQRLMPQGGSRFTLTLPTAADAYAPDEISKPTAGLTDDDPKGLSNVEGTIAHEMLGKPINDITVAIIEDNPDMLQQIKAEVGTYFKVAGYSTGQAGLDAVLSSPPSLLICDVMLPDISGYEIVTKLKEKADTVRMPIIMLTSLDDENHQIRAYKAGADDYMVKPCNFRLLIARALQLIKWSTAHKSHKSHESHEPHEPLLDSPLDKLFLQKLQTITAQHLADPTFSVDRLAEIMKMGRTKFYGKVKELTGQSPNKYLQEARMERAAQLLLEGELTVSEVSYKVGIQDPSYFNKVFKAKYGVVPSKYGR